MLKRMFPLGLKVSFEDRDYRLGDTVNLALELSPRRDTEVREGRVDLVCEARWTERFTVMVEESRSKQGLGGMGAVAPSIRVSKQVTESRKESYVHSSIVFVRDARLPSSRTKTYNAKLEIGPEPPSRGSEGTVTWRLVTSVDVVGARDIKARRSMNILT